MPLACAKRAGVRVIYTQKNSRKAAGKGSRGAACLTAVLMGVVSLSQGRTRATQEEEIKEGESEEGEKKRESNNPTENLAGRRFGCQLS